MQAGTGPAGAAGAGGLPSRSLKGWVITGVVLALIAGGGVAWWLLGSDDGEASATTAAAALAEVVLTDMEQVETLDGTLGFEEGDPIGSGMAGTLTWVTPAGTVTCVNRRPE